VLTVISNSIASQCMEENIDTIRGAVDIDDNNSPLSATLSDDTNYMYTDEWG
jgi:hypothetical protein